MFVKRHQRNHLGAFTTDTPGKLNILRHDGDALGVDGAQVGVFKQSNQVGFTSLLYNKHHYKWFKI